MLTQTCPGTAKKSLVSHQPDLDAAIHAAQTGAPVVIFNHPSTLEILRILCQSLGTTHRNSVFPEVREIKADPNSSKSIALSYGEHPPHTDGTFEKNLPPLFILQFVETDRLGGGTSTFWSVPDLLAEMPADYQNVLVPPVQFQRPDDNGGKAGTIAPMLSYRSANQISLRYRNDRQVYPQVVSPQSDLTAFNQALTIMVGGDAQDFEQAEPLFEAVGRTIRLCGDVGSGQAVKMCNQALCAVHMVALCEAILLAKEQGIDPNLIIEVCSTGAAGSWALSNLGSPIIESDFNPGFMIKHMLKDLRLVQESTQENLPGVTLADRLFKIVQELDTGAEQGTQAMIRAYENQSNRDL